MEKRISRLIKMGLHLTEAGMPLIIKNDPAYLISSPASPDHALGFADDPVDSASVPFTFSQMTLNFPPFLEPRATS